MLLLLLLAAQAPADSTHPLHHALAHDVTLVVSDSGSHIVAEVQTTWLLRSDLPLRMDLDTTMRVVRVLLDGKENTRMFRTTWGRDGGWVVVPHDKQAGDTLHSRVRYHGSVRGGLVIRRGPDGALLAWTDNGAHGAHDWLPLEDFPSERAAVRWHVEVGPGEQVIANGVLEKVDTLVHGRTEWHYRMDQAIAPSAMAVGIGRFLRQELPPAGCAARCVPLGVWARPGDSVGIAVAANRLRKAVDAVSRKRGPYPYDRLTLVLAGPDSGTASGAGVIFAAPGTGDQALAEAVERQWAPGVIDTGP